MVAVIIFKSSLAVSNYWGSRFNYALCGHGALKYQLVSHDPTLLPLFSIITYIYIKPTERVM